MKTFSIRIYLSKFTIVIKLLPSFCCRLHSWQLFCEKEIVKNTHATNNTRTLTANIPWCHLHLLNFVTWKLTSKTWKFRKIVKPSLKLNRIPFSNASIWINGINIKIIEPQTNISIFGILVENSVHLVSTICTYHANIYLHVRNTWASNHITIGNATA